MAIRILVIDKDPSFRDSVKSLPGSLAEVEILDLPTSTQTKLEIARRQPDLVFADVTIGGIQSIPPRNLWKAEAVPLLVFVAQSDELAMKAIEMRAFDYLIKPVERPRLMATVERALTHIERQFSDRAQEASIENLLGTQNRILIKLSGRRILVNAEEIDWVEAEGNYVRIHIGKESYLQRTTMRCMEARLNRVGFARIHKSVIVNLDRIREIRSWPTGEYIVLMRNGKELTLSRGYKHRLPAGYGLSKTTVVGRLEDIAERLNASS